MKANDTTLSPLGLVASFGVFDLDPCGFPGHFTAARIIVLPECGLSAKWIGRVWLNPPYSEPGKWLEKLADHRNGVALVLASTDTAWYHDFVAAGASGLLFVRGRPRFLRADKTEVGLMRASLLVAYGRKNFEALCKSGVRGHLVDLGR